MPGGMATSIVLPSGNVSRLFAPAIDSMNSIGSLLTRLVPTDLSGSATLNYAAGSCWTKQRVQKDTWAHQSKNRTEKCGTKRGTNYPHFLETREVAHLLVAREGLEPPT